MAIYDLEEQDQLEDLKAWWRRWGNLITAVVVAVCLAVVAVQGWRWWKSRQSEQAGTIYAAAIAGVRANDLAKTRDAVAQLTTRYAGTTYAGSGALLLARMLFDSADKPGAAAQLQWVVDHGDEDVRQVARFRLAEVQLDGKQYDDALRTLDAKHDEAFTGVYADLRGDALSAAGRAADARTSYQIAVAKLDPKSPYRTYVQVKLDALGGPTLSPVATAAGSPPVPVPVSPGAPSGSAAPPTPAAAPIPAAATPPAAAPTPAATTTPAAVTNPAVPTTPSASPAK
ncbi:MAG: tetratricopeptide repeat protein [Betaproteobacteria bacterium]